MIRKVIQIAKNASFEILKLYYKDNVEIELKNDNSPVTNADLISNEIIVTGLKAISNYPILTEESPVEYGIRKFWNNFWMVDPLDGTKDFIAKNGDFTVNIALIENFRPILGIVYIPVSGDVYYAEEGKGAYKNGIEIYNNSQRIDLIGGDSIHHSTKEVKAFFKKHNILTPE